MSIWGSVIDAAHDSRMNQSRRRMDSIDRRDAERMMLYLDNTKIQRLVKDAEAAGIHPLYAMGASVTAPSFSTGSSANTLRSGRPGDIVRAALSTNRVKEQHDASMAESAARTSAYEAAASKDMAMKNKLDSDAARMTQGANYQQDGSQEHPDYPGYNFKQAKPTVWRSTSGKVWYGHGKRQQQDCEDYYGEACEIEGALNYLKDLGSNIGIGLAEKQNRYRRFTKKYPTKSRAGRRSRSRFYNKYK